MATWKRNGWRTREGQPVKNEDRRAPRRGCPAWGAGSRRPRGQRTRRPARCSRPAGGAGRRRRLGGARTVADPYASWKWVRGPAMMQDDGRQPNRGIAHMIGNLKTIVLDAPDIAGLSAFYQALAGWSEQYADDE